MKIIKTFFFQLAIYLLINLSVKAQNLYKPTTLDSLQGEWIMEKNHKNRLVFKKDTIYIYSDNKFVSKDKFYLSDTEIKSKYNLKKAINKGAKNGPYLMVVQPYDIDELLIYIFENISKNKIEFGYSQKGGSFVYYRKGTEY